MLRVNKEKCTSCGTCVAVCPEGAEFDTDGKSKVIDSDKLKECGGAGICPVGAIEEVPDK